MARGQKGTGSVFLRTYRDALGRKRRTTNWYVEYVVGGRPIRKATEYTNAPMPWSSSRSASLMP